MQNYIRIHFCSCFATTGLTDRILRGIRLLLDTPAAKHKREGVLDTKPAQPTVIWLIEPAKNKIRKREIRSGYVL